MGSNNIINFKVTIFVLVIFTISCVIFSPIRRPSSGDVLLRSTIEQLIVGESENENEVEEAKLSYPQDTNSEVDTVDVEEADLVEEKVEDLVEENFGEEILFEGRGLDELTDDEIKTLFEDAEEYLAAPYVEVYPPLPPARYQKMWPQLQLHENYFRAHPHKRYIPTLKRVLPITEFIRLFMMTSTPVIIPNHILIGSGWNVSSWTIEELQRKYPFHGDLSDVSFSTYSAQNVQGSFGNLGAAIAGLAQFKNSVRKRPHPTIKQINKEVNHPSGTGTNYPHHLRVKIEYMKDLGVEGYPVWLSPSRFQLPTTWMGSSNSDTASHHDAGDNIALQLLGTKRWIMYPPTDSRFMYKTCKGGGLCWSKTIPHPDKPIKNMNKVGKSTMNKIKPIIIHLRAGNALFNPYGWFHHVDQEESKISIMTNFWMRGKQLLYRTVKLKHDIQQIRYENYQAVPLSKQFPKVKNLTEF